MRPRAPGILACLALLGPPVPGVAREAGESETAAALVGELDDAAPLLDRAIASLERTTAGGDPFAASQRAGVTSNVVFFACALATALACRFVTARAGR